MRFVEVPFGRRGVSQAKLDAAERGDASGTQLAISTLQFAAPWRSLAALLVRGELLAYVGVDGLGIDAAERVRARFRQ